MEEGGGRKSNGEEGEGGEGSRRWCHFSFLGFCSSQKVVAIAPLLLLSLSFFLFSFASPSVHYSYYCYFLESCVCCGSFASFLLLFCFSGRHTNPTTHPSWLSTYSNSTTNSSTHSSSRRSNSSTQSSSSSTRRGKKTTMIVCPGSIEPEKKLNTIQ